MDDSFCLRSKYPVELCARPGNTPFDPRIFPVFNLDQKMYFTRQTGRQEVDKDVSSYNRMVKIMVVRLNLYGTQFQQIPQFIV